MTVLEIAANLPIVSSLLMYLLAVETVKVRWGEQITPYLLNKVFLAKSTNQKPSTAFAFDSDLTLYLCVNGVAVSEVTASQTDKLSTVTLAAHARRGLIRQRSLFCTMYCRNNIILLGQNEIKCKCSTAPYVCTQSIL